MNQIQNDFIPVVLAAGFGKRLLPLTSAIPKAAVPVGDWAIAYHSIKAFLDLGFKQVQVNTHYLADSLKTEILACLLADNKPLDSVRFWHENEILETGGGLVNIAQQLKKEVGKDLEGKCFFAVAGDILTEPAIIPMISEWQKRKNSETFALMATKTLQSPRPDVIWVDKTANTIVGFGQDHVQPHSFYQTRLFTTHQIISVDYVLTCPMLKESSRDLFYRRGIKQGLTILNYDYSDQALWHDVGDYAALAKATHTHHLSKLGLLTQCLLTLSIHDYAHEKNTSDPDFAGVNFSGDSLIFVTKSMVNINSLVGVFRSSEILLSRDQKSRLTSLLKSGTYSNPCQPSQPPELQSLSGDILSHGANQPKLLFIATLDETSDLHPPLLVPLELITIPVHSLGSSPLLSLYQSSNTFFLLVPKSTLNRYLS